MQEPRPSPPSHRRLGADWSPTRLPARGPGRDAWQQDFARRMDVVRARWRAGFERFADEVLSPALDAIAPSLRKWGLQTAVARPGTGQRSFRFSLGEDAYVDVFFSHRPLDTLDNGYRCCLPDLGDIPGVRTTTYLGSADRHWSRACLCMALNNFLAKLAEVQG